MIISDLIERLQAMPDLSAKIIANIEGEAYDFDSVNPHTVGESIPFREITLNDIGVTIDCSIVRSRWPEETSYT